MAESCAIAFGRYLKTLRERRGLSLNDVESLSRTFPESISKSYLSRCENGRHNLALAKMIPLSRINEVAPEVLVERLELDMELDKVGGPETAGLSYTELTQRGKAALDHGVLWEAYALLRDSIGVASHSEIMGRLRDHTEQLLCAYMNFSAAAVKLGRSRLALHELEYIKGSGGLSQRVFPILLERLSTTYLHMNRLNDARTHADAAIAEAERIGQVEYLGYFYSNRALIADRETYHDQAVRLHQKAFQAFRDAGCQTECARTLSNLAQTYFDLGRYKSARRALAASERIAAPLHQDRTRALIRIKLGEIEELEGKPQEAAQHWREAANMARQRNDRVVRFQAEYYLYRQALNVGDGMTARAIGRRLLRTSAWIREDIEELDAFRKLNAAHETYPRKRVPSSQRAN